MAFVKNSIMFGSGGGSNITVVANYSALPDPTTVSGQFYWCESSQGTSWLPGSLGGTYYNSGMYYSNGVSWTFMNVPYQATQDEVNTGTNTDKFVTPSTFANANKWLTKKGVSVIVSSNTTAVNDGDYTVVANATFTDPSPTEGKGYVVYVRNGTATIGGTGYAVGSLVFRTFHSGAWSSVSYASKNYVDDSFNAVNLGNAIYNNLSIKLTPSDDDEFVVYDSLTGEAVTIKYSTIQAPLDTKDVLPVLYEKHANVPTWGGTPLNNLEGFAFLITGATARNFADTNAYTRRQRMGLTVATTSNLAQARQTATYFNRNSNLDIIIGLGFAENCNNANVRAFAGISTTTLFTNVEPTSLTNCIGLAKLTTSNNLHLIHNDGSGTATAIDLGASFPSNTIETDFYILRLKTNGSNVDYTITRVNTGDTASGSLTTDLPSATTALNLGYYVVQSTGANTTTGIDYFGTNIIKS